MGVMAVTCWMILFVIGGRLASRNCDRGRFKGGGYLGLANSPTKLGTTTSSFLPKLEMYEFNDYYYYPC